MDEDARLMLRVREGDRAAFETLFRRYTPRLLGFLSRMVPERARAEELAQEVFVRVYQARDRYEPRSRFSTWIFGIASNLALNDLARAHRRREASWEEGAADAKGSEPLADETLVARRTAERIVRALQRLPDRQRAALMLRLEEGLGYTEIAETLGASLASVKSLIHRARENLLASLRDQNGGLDR
ncbi:MAG: sigma-70 family RNA polymerase sigma factor [Myxococcota bacterium]